MNITLVRPAIQRAPAELKSSRRCLRNAEAGHIRDRPGANNMAQRLARTKGPLSDRRGLYVRSISTLWVTVLRMMTHPEGLQSR